MPPDPRVVCFGGGTGMSVLLSGLKALTPRITAVVSVSDDGGSSGRIRKDFEILPPGDIRNCLVALAEAEPLLSKLFQYRFEETELKGHAFGNLFLTALARITGDFSAAVREANRILKVRGKVIPSTDRRVELVAEHPDGTKTTGETHISAGGKPIRRMWLRPDPGPVSDEIREALSAADLILFGPGSLFTSVIPNLLVRGMAEAVKGAPGAKAYVCNVMTQPGETPGFTAADHVDALESHLGAGVLDGVVVNAGRLDAGLLERYRAEAAEPVAVDRERLEGRGFRVFEEDVISTGDFLRHDPERLARALLSMASRLVPRRVAEPASP